MPTYVSLLTWTDKGREEVASLADRVEQVIARAQEFGVSVTGAYLSMGRFDQIVVFEAPDDAAVAKLATLIAGRGYAVTETMRCFTMDEVRELL